MSNDPFGSGSDFGVGDLDPAPVGPTIAGCPVHLLTIYDCSAMDPGSADFIACLSAVTSSGGGSNTGDPFADRDGDGYNDNGNDMTPGTSTGPNDNSG